VVGHLKPKLFIDGHIPHHHMCTIRWGDDFPTIGYAEISFKETLWLTFRDVSSYICKMTVIPNR